MTTTLYAREGKVGRGQYIDVGEFFPAEIELECKAESTPRFEFLKWKTIAVGKATVAILEAAPALYCFTSEERYQPWGPVLDELGKFPKYREVGGAKK